jgi:putative ABC transport system permease protein
MFKNYLQLAWRNVLRHKLYAIINLSGLALGLAGVVLIFCLVHYHLSFDNFHQDKDRIYRVVSKTTYDTEDYSQGIPAPFGAAFATDYNYAQYTAMRVRRSGMLLRINRGKETQQFKEDGAFVEPDYFAIFNYPLLEGDAQTMLMAPNTAVVTQKMAEKLFPHQNAVGKQFTLKSKDIYTIKGVLKDIPVNSDNQQQIYLSYANFKKNNVWLADSSWSSISSSIQCFVKLKPGIKADAVEKAFPQLIKKYCRPEDAKSYFFFMQPLAQMHFDARYDGKIEMKYLWALSFIGVFLVITACINFINLSTAQSLSRSKEVGIRKTMGSSNLALFMQFMFETGFMVLVAIGVALCLAAIALPQLNRLFNTEISQQVFTSWPLILFLTVLFISVSFLAGYYPSLLLSRFKPVEALKSRITQEQAGGFTLRRGLIIMQFAIVQLMIIGSIVIARQMNFAIHSDLGFNKDGVVMLDLPDNSAQVIQSLRNQIAQVPGVGKVSFCSTAPMSDDNNWYGFKFDHHAKTEAFQLNVKWSDDQYLNTFGLKLVAGRNVTATDTAGFIVNEAAVKKLNLSPDGALLKSIRIGGMTGPIVGVVKDFHNESFHTGIDPICIFSNGKNFYKCAVKLPLKYSKNAMANIQNIFKTNFPDHVFEYSYLDDDIASMYQTESNLLQMVEAFVGVIIFIGCLGLYGLVSFMAVQKRKEIGVRRVLGASVSSLLWLFGKEFSRLLLVAFVIAAPIAWLVMNHWLQDFVYRIHIDAGVFLLTLIATSLIAALAVGYTSIKASSANPIKSLRTE